MNKEEVHIDTEVHRKLAADLFNHTWSLLDKKGRTPEQDEEMVHATHASRHHWSIAGDERNHARGEWQIARVYAVLKRVESAIHHAQLYKSACDQYQFGPFDLAFAHEGLARALVTNDPTQAIHHLEEARNVGEAIEAQDDRDWLHKNLDDIASNMNEH